MWIILAAERGTTLADSTFNLRHPQLRLDRAGDARRDLILQLEYVIKYAIKPLSPNVRIAGGVDQLARTRITDPSTT